VPGTRVFYEARGHGAAPALTGGYDELAADLLSVADSCGATQALGVSLGAHTVLRLLCSGPARFAKAVLFLPAALDTPPVRRDGLLSALRASDEEAVRQWVRGEAPEGADAYVASRTAYLLSSPGLVGVLEQLGEAPVPDPALLAAVTADVLVLAVEGDPVHPADVGRRLAALLPSASLVVFDRPGVMWHERARLRDLIRAHLS
jgi:pimeloyl-ACP methyl ester carboxylesterase